MKMWKKVIAGTCSAVLSMLLLVSCSKGETPSASSSSATEPTRTPANVVVIKGPTGIGMVNLWSQNEKKLTRNNYTIAAVSGPEEAVAKVANGEADIAALPTNVAAALYKKTSGNVQMLAVNTLGVLYIMENGNNVQSVSDLKGKTIYTTGQGANPEYILQYILEKNGLVVGKDVKIEFVAENDELATLLATGKANVAMVPEPVVTTVKAKNKDMRVAINMTEAWSKVSKDSQLMMGCVVARKDYVAKNSEAVKIFLTEYQASIKAAASDIEGTAGLCEKYGIIPKAAIAKQAIPNCNLTFVSGNDMMNQIKGYFQVLHQANPKSIGGSLPDEAFYYIG